MNEQDQKRVKRNLWKLIGHQGNVKSLELLQEANGNWYFEVGLTGATMNMPLFYETIPLYGRYIDIDERENLAEVPGDFDIEELISFAADYRKSDLEIAESVNESFDKFNKIIQDVVEEIKKLNGRVTRLESAMTEVADTLKPETPDPGAYPMKDVVDFMFGTFEDCYRDEEKDNQINEKKAENLKKLTEVNRELCNIEDEYDGFGLDIKFVLTAARLNISVAKNMIEDPR